MKSLLFTLLLLQSFTCSFSQSASLDPTFNGKGYSIQCPPGWTAAGHFIFQDHLDDKIIIAGVGGDTTTGNAYQLLTKYNSDGTADLSFNASGMQITSLIPGGLYTYTNSAVLDNLDRMILLVPQADDDTATLTLARYNSDGSIDNTFNGAGILIDTAVHAWVAAVAVQADNKILVAGESNGSGPEYLFMRRFNVNGSIDSSFATNGTLLHRIPDSITLETVINILVRNNTEILVAGIANNTAGDLCSINFTITSTGLVFGAPQNGVIYPDNVPGASLTDPRYTFGIDTSTHDNNLVILFSYVDQNTSLLHCQISRVAGDGNLDSNFNGTGIVKIAFTTGLIYQYSMTVDDHGNILFPVGNDQGYPVLVKVANNGASYGMDSLPVEVYSTNDTAVLVYSWYGIAIQRDGKVLLGGQGFDLNNSTGQRVTSAGILTERLDPSFTTGVAETTTLLASLVVYPDPATNTLFLKSNDTQVQAISIYDMNGQRVIEQKYVQQIDVSMLAAGIYYVEACTATGTARQKFVKM